MTFEASVRYRFEKRLIEIYGEQGRTLLPELHALLERHHAAAQQPQSELWDQSDVILITYGDQIDDGQGSPLNALRSFLADHQLNEIINTVHILPFYPYTSDDGFSVVDYCAVDPKLGTWDDIAQLQTQSDLMFDLVLNHISQASEWFRGYLAGDPQYASYFIEVEPQTDLSAVTRPRSLPLLTPFETSHGLRHIWTTFSPDQIDLNFAHPAVLFAVLDALLFYIKQGARFVRLDAIAFLWKEIGTTCVHLPQTHSVVKLMRDIVDVFAPHVILLTETNVPHNENISYFGAGDEAHMVYQFSLPPLLAEAILTHDATALTDWLSKLKPVAPPMTYFNFTASHDGVGIRPLDGLLSDQRQTELVESAQARGGRIGTKRNPDGTDTPYELNITYVDLLSDPRDNDSDLHAARFLASQSIALALRGIPGIYFHSLVGTGNDTASVASSGIARRINRRKFQRQELDQRLSRRGSLPQKIFDAYCHLLATRVQQPAFHPAGAQQVYRPASPCLIAFLRTAPDQTQRILVLANLGPECVLVTLTEFDDLNCQTELVTGTPIIDGSVTLQPFQVAWLEVQQQAFQ